MKGVGKARKLEGKVRKDDGHLCDPEILCVCPVLFSK